MYWYYGGDYIKLSLSLNIIILHRLRNKFLQLILIFLDSAILNQKVENAGVAFVKGVNERNEFFEKKK